ncbi:hypothetical protein [Sphingobium yanoikuyae]|uniref:hypothetical protein n=1 Tax=Sphingobium yanoikuyae TaxID=13690 RepID=UPI0004E35FC1|nr:hypothetical protein [Sphingobium yanoikuyae]KFD26154.1 hypothetical protein IH86_21595 [Sphingobium yanoikuyae]MDV3480841.1 hypothetical protein [Sphingobium yanoikuyae]
MSRPDPHRWLERLSPLPGVDDGRSDHWERAVLDAEDLIQEYGLACSGMLARVMYRAYRSQHDPCCLINDSGHGYVRWDWLHMPPGRCVADALAWVTIDSLMHYLLFLHDRKSSARVNAEGGWQDMSFLVGVIRALGWHYTVEDVRLIAEAVDAQFQGKRASNCRMRRTHHELAEAKAWRQARKAKAKEGTA